MAQHWIKLSDGWLDMGRVAFVKEYSGRVSIYESIGVNAPASRTLSEADGKIVLAYVEKQAGIAEPQPT